MGKVNPIFDVDKANHSLNERQLTEKDFEFFFKENFVLLCAYCRVKFKFDTDLSKEMVHTAFIKFWETHDLNRPDFSMKGYLYKIVTNNCLDYIRHEKVKSGYEDHSGKIFPTASLPDESGKIDLERLTNKIEKSISELPEQMRKIFVLSRHEGLKYSQIAKYLGISVKTVETQMSRALIKLRSKLSEFRSLLLCVFFLH